MRFMAFLAWEEGTMRLMVFLAWEEAGMRRGTAHHGRREAGLCATCLPHTLGRRGITVLNLSLPHPGEGITVLNLSF